MKLRSELRTLRAVTAELPVWQVPQLVLPALTHQANP